MVTGQKRLNSSLPTGVGGLSRCLADDKTDEVIQTQRTSHKQTVKQNFTVAVEQPPNTVGENCVLPPNERFNQNNRRETPVLRKSYGKG